MGCCFSKNKPRPGKAGSRLPAGSPPPEEETVKEVLAETTNPKPREEPKAEEKKVSGIEKGAVGFGAINGCDERSEETSEVCSVSETLSVSTTVTEKREGMEVEGGVETRRTERRSPAKVQRKRSFSGELAGRRDRAVAVSSVGCRSGRSSPSPSRRMVEGGTGGKAYSAREPRQSARSSALMVNGGNGIRRDPGERSGRRSVSPAAKRVADLRQGGGAGGGVCRAPMPAKASNRTSPYRIPAAKLQDNGGGASASGTGASSTCGDEGGGGGSVEGNESLENPLVSLECFIFL
ncbi:uncharacterized protein [Typha latifolia]|uniref:uncharacterized protein n=1 Tax=Typha latifolia TaxID=4733 RepID=UPI003C2FA256